MRPSPGCRRTRAMAFLRLPVPRWNVSAKLHLSFFIECDRLRLLRDVAVVGPGVDAKALQHIGTEGVPLQHPADGGCDGGRWGELLGLLQRPLAQAARVPAVARVLLGLELGARDLDLRSVDHHDVVAAVQVRREGRLVLATQDCGYAL